MMINSYTPHVRKGNWWQPLTIKILQKNPNKIVEVLVGGSYIQQGWLKRKRINEKIYKIKFNPDLYQVEKNIKEIIHQDWLTTNHDEPWDVEPPNIEIHSPLKVKIPLNKDKTRFYLEGFIREKSRSHVIWDYITIDICFAYNILSLKCFEEDLWVHVPK